ncbi:hypothetical protein DFH08DRAFT_837123 [Mycena albidolilacea]|uniref:Fungal-type protein kinase domain-containing protein n=1 Tax=Mycena albidolilacea TaxID=1033008 RepID=A0AAD7ASS9_9AGAR|nr:hypothetical protein DFH08DRAFT_837123 [Mycena albidolilacea]
MEIGPDRATVHYAKLTLESACSVVDLLVAVQDVVTILKKLLLEHQILPKHIEYNNISIRNDNGVQGVVIDLDFPDLIEASRSTEEFGLCGTLAFQSLNRLGSRFSSDKQHTIQDSLESVFYVLCWACYGYSHDGRSDKFRPNWMGRWTERHSVESIYSEKRSFRSSEIPSHVNRYMGCQRDILESVIEKIRRKIERQLPNEKACDAILDILTKGIEEAREERCGMAAECSKAMRSANGASSSKKEVA